MKAGKSGLFFNLLMHLNAKWTTRNPKIIASPEKGFKRENTYQTNYKKYKHRDYVYCEKPENKASDCKTVSDIEERRLILSKKNYVSFVVELNIEPISVLVIGRA